MLAIALTEECCSDVAMGKEKLRSNQQPFARMAGPWMVGMAKLDL